MHAESPPSQQSFAIVVSRYNETITSKLLAGAKETLNKAGVTDQQIDIVWVPGAFEIPLAAQTLAESTKYAAVLCLGAVIRGETSHDRHINQAVSLGLMQASLATSVPVLFGVLTCESLEQAIQRAGGTSGHKGVECALAALEMAGLMTRLREADGLE